MNYKKMVADYVSVVRINESTTCSCSAVSTVNLKCQFCLILCQIWQAALNALNPNPTDSCPLYLNHAVVAALPSRVSRHNSPSSAHFVSRLVRSCLPAGNNRCILVGIFRMSFVLACSVIVNGCGGDCTLSLQIRSAVRSFCDSSWESYGHLHLGHPVEGELA